MSERKQYPLRVSAELWSEVERWAADEMRSVNAQVEMILREALKRQRGKSVAGHADRRGGDRRSAT